MALKPRNKSKGFPLSSTPNHSLEDSGYCGSVSRGKSALNDKVLSSCSPIKENNFKHPRGTYLLHKSEANSKNALDYEIITKFKQSSCTKRSELAGPDCSFTQKLPIPISQDFQSSIELDLQSPLNNFPSQIDNWHSPDSLSNDDIRHRLLWPPFDDSVSNLDDSRSFKNSPYIISTNLCKIYKENSSPEKFNVKRTKINFISELKMRNMHELVSTILSSLSPEDLCKVSCVSKEWNQAILEDRKARSRKESFIEQRISFLTGTSKENRLGMKSGPSREHKTAFCNITNTLNITEDALNTKNSRLGSRLDSFMNNNEAKLCKCPICHHAAKLQREIFMCTQCSHRFCSECLSPIFSFKKHACPKSELPKIIIGSKQSKKNLKRL